jgi:hypothetical protein
VYTQECVERAALEGRTVCDLGAGDASGRVCVYTHLYIITINIMYIYIYMGLVMMAHTHKDMGLVFLLGVSARAYLSIYLSIYTKHVCDVSI